MATVIAQARRLSGFFSKLASQLYFARLAKVQREVKRHRPYFLTVEALRSTISFEDVRVRVFFTADGA